MTKHPDDELRDEVLRDVHAFKERARWRPPRSSEEVLAEQARQWEASGVPVHVPPEVYFPTAAELAAKEEPSAREIHVDDKAPPRAPRDARDVEDAILEDEEP